MSPKRRQTSTLWTRDPLLRLAAVNAAIGFAMSTIAVTVFVAVDLGGLRQLFSQEPGFALLLWLFLGLTFASAQMGMAIMDLRDRND